MERNHPELSQEQKEQLYKAFKENEEILKGFLEDYKRNPEAWDVMSDENRLRGFLTTITASDIEECFNDMTIPDDVLDAFRDGSIEKKMETINSFSVGMVAALYEYKSFKKEYRTKARAGGDIQRKLPKNLAILSYQDYRYGMSLHQEGNAYLQPLTSTDGLKFQNGRLYFSGGEMRQVSEVELQDLKKKEGIEDIDLTFLRVIYSLILKDFEDHDYNFVARTHKWYIPTLAQYLGLSSKLSKKNIEGIINKVQSYHNITGVLHGFRNGREVQSLYQVLNFESYDDKANVIEISSPYMRYVIEAVYKAAIKLKNGKPVLDNKGKPKRSPSHSYLIHPSLYKAKSETAKENVVILVAGIETSGSNKRKGFHIKATTLIDRNPQLKESLDKSKNKTQVLKRCFRKTYELLRTETDLEKAYIDIVLPDPDDPKVIPTKSTLEDMVINIPHKGKKAEYRDLK